MTTIIFDASDSPTLTGVTDVAGVLTAGPLGGTVTWAVKGMPSGVEISSFAATTSGVVGFRVVDAGGESYHDGTTWRASTSLTMTESAIDAESKNIPVGGNKIGITAELDASATITDVTFGITHIGDDIASISAAVASISAAVAALNDTSAADVRAEMDANSTKLAHLDANISSVSTGAAVSTLGRRIKLIEARSR